MYVWRKTNADGTPVCSPGWWSRSSCEFLLVGTKGSNILKHKTTNSERQEYASVREGHSAKPAAITQAVADFLDVPGPRIELWARRSHPLFDSWGTSAHHPNRIDRQDESHSPLGSGHSTSSWLPYTSSNETPFEGRALKQWRKSV